jgi:hypothetical protein
VKHNVCSPKTGVVSQSLQVDSEKVPPVGPRLHCSLFFTIHYTINIHHSTCRISAAGSVLKWNVNKLNTQVLIKQTDGSINQSTRLNISNPSSFITPLWRKHHHHVHGGLGVFPVPWSSKWSWSRHLFLGRPMFLRSFGLYCSACFGNLFVSILCTCCSHFFWYCFISFIMFCAPVFFPYYSEEIKYRFQVNCPYVNLLKSYHRKCQCLYMKIAHAKTKVKVPRADVSTCCWALGVG